MSERAQQAAESREVPAWVTQARADISALRARLGPAKKEKLADSTLTEYQRRAAKLDEAEAAGLRLDVAGIANKNERYLWKAAGHWREKKRVREAMNVADKAWKADHPNEASRWKAYAAAVEGIRAAAAKLDDWEALDFSRFVDDGIERLEQADHKKKPATDAELNRFFDVAGGSQYRSAFLCMEFAGVRPEEFGKGVRVEVAKQGGEVGLRFVIESAKCREGHGQPVRSVFVVPPKAAGEGVKKRYAELAGLVKACGTAGLVVGVAASEKLTAGQKVSRAFSKFANAMEAAGPKISAYSLRNRFSSQAKASCETLEEVAQVLGHQSTETQKHYGRRQRGGGRVSPVAVAVGSGVAYEPVRSYGRSRAGPRASAGAKAKTSAGVSPPRPRF